MSIQDELRARGERLRARQQAMKAELEAEQEADRLRWEAWMARREQQWIEESKLNKTADVLTWPERMAQ